jgi:hypothetical protein
MAGKRPAGRHNMAKDETVTLTRADLDQTIKSAVEAGVAAALAAQRGVLGVLPESSTIEERIHAQLGTPVPERKPLAIKTQKCFNVRNGAHFTAVIAPSRTYPEGRVVDLSDYSYPADIAERAKGISIVNPKSSGDPTVPGKNGLTPQFLQWRYETYDKADRTAFVGQAARYLPRLDGPDGEPVLAPAGEAARTFAR